MPPGKLIIIAAPSGAGKTSLTRAVVDGDPELCVSISHTTRPKRPNEVDGVNYHFVDKATFLDKLHNGDFLESAKVYGHHYGTSKNSVNGRLKEGLNVILEIDWQGAAQIKTLYPDACYIFILPPSLEILGKRLCDRAQDDEATIAERMAEVRSVVVHANEADFIVVNDDFGQTLADIQAIIRAEGLKTEIQLNRHGELLGSLTQG